jgi:hypothetical protein
MFVKPGKRRGFHGKSKGVKGEVIAVSHKEDKVFVKGVNIATKLVSSNRWARRAVPVLVESALIRFKGSDLLPQVRQANPRGPIDGKRVCKYMLFEF